MREWVNGNVPDNLTMNYKRKSINRRKRIRSQERRKNRPDSWHYGIGIAKEIVLRREFKEELSSLKTGVKSS